MKKFASIICAALIVAALTGCNSDKTISDNSENNSAPISDNSGNSDNLQSPNNSSNSGDIPENKIPDGEPTFLTCPDGTAVYTSEITKLQSTAYGLNGLREEYPLEIFGEESFKGIDGYEVVCTGFAYAYTPQISYNCAQNPELFKDMAGFESLEMKEYIGEEIPPSSDCFRVEPGDKFGGLTVISAETIFAYYPVEDCADINGVHISRSSIEFDGELELTGYLHISRANEGYDQGGDMRFTPDNECVGKLPATSFFPHNGVMSHQPITNFDCCAYNDFQMFSLGNMHDYSLYFHDLKEGEKIARVKITIGDIRVSSYGGSMSVSAALLDIERI